tara:strand:+ start:219 stop:629 length:411 start_codon:yes stop_codon:yes gene_type:complete
MIKLKDLLFEQDTNDIAGILVFNQKNEVLVLFKADGSPDIPKGHINEGETPIEAVKRELNEETGIVLNTEPNSFGKINVEPGKDFYRFVIQTNQDFVIYLSDEHKGFEFVDIYSIERGYFWKPVDDFFNEVMSLET